MDTVTTIAAAATRPETPAQARALCGRILGSHLYHAGLSRLRPTARPVRYDDGNTEVLVGNEIKITRKGDGGWTCRGAVSMGERVPMAAVS